MNDQTARALRDLNTRFYAQAADSFGGTRHNRWPGWERLLEVPGVAEALAGDEVVERPCAKRHLSVAVERSCIKKHPVVVTDLACGNMRFETFLERALPGSCFVFQAVDNTAFPVWEQGCSEVRHYEVDLLDEPSLSATNLGSAICPNGSDLALEFADATLGFTDAASGLTDATVGLADAASGLTAEPGVLPGSAELPSRPVLESVDLASRLALEPADLVVSFGFLHHVPSQERRVDFLRLLFGCVRPGGFAAVSFWRFLDEPSLAKRVIDPREVVEQLTCDRAGGKQMLASDGAVAGEVGDMPNDGVGSMSFAFDGLGASVKGDDGSVFAAFDPAELEPGDAFLGWDNQPGLVRYCHSFSDEDIDLLVAAMAAADPKMRVAARYRADGRSGALNEYVVWQRGE